MKRFHIHVSVENLDRSIGVKSWVTDPTGIAWETFHTLARIPVYRTDTPVFNHGESVIPNERATEKPQCCVPAAKAAAIDAGATCCGP